MERDKVREEIDGGERHRQIEGYAKGESGGESKLVFKAEAMALMSRGSRYSSRKHD